ncbi:unnamed protein product [Linum trigynum]|uniref:Uncharacterized protein n=1 Tax=Linum trigynum TaxID=586398 RepID=A0AAV2GC54_9ROSI
MFTKSYVSEFKHWGQKNWVIDDSFGFEELGDGRWLLVCPSLQETLRINQLSHTRFRELHITFSYWNDSLDTTTPTSNDTWIMVFDIPIHLKSVHLFKAIGDFRGGLIKINWVSWCSHAARIRVRASRDIPNEFHSSFVHNGSKSRFLFRRRCLLSESTADRC